MPVFYSVNSPGEADIGRLLAGFGSRNRPTGLGVVQPTGLTNPSGAESTAEAALASDASASDFPDIAGVGGDISTDRGLMRSTQFNNYATGASSLLNSIQGFGAGGGYAGNPAYPIAGMGLGGLAGFAFGGPLGGLVGAGLGSQIGSMLGGNSAANQELLDLQATAIKKKLWDRAYAKVFMDQLFGLKKQWSKPEKTW